MAASRNFDQIGERILLAARGELYLNLPYLDAALCGLALRPGGEMTLSLAADGETLYYNGSFLAERYLRGRVLCNRAYLHVILHCMLRHLAKKQDRVPGLWDLACDAAVESILDALHYPCLENGPVPAKQTFYGLCRAEMPVLTAEGIYRFLLKERYPEYRLAQLQRVFLVDDHGLWSPPEKEKKERTQRQDRQWKNRSDKTRTAMETVLAGQAEGGEPVLEQVRAAVRDDVDYRAFLRRFAAPREVPEVDGDGFDYSYYSYGLRLYGNLPLIEYPETREEKRIRDFVIAIDTSGSVKGDVVQSFIQHTHDILSRQENFFTKVNMHIIQCDDQIREDVHITGREEFQAYIKTMQIKGLGQTDFRPVFARVEELIRRRELTDLRGLLYFTDGLGTFPEKKPPYDTAFIIHTDDYHEVQVPPWAMHMVLTEDEILDSRFSNA